MDSQPSYSRAMRLLNAAPTQKDRAMITIVTIKNEFERMRIILLELAHCVANDRHLEANAKAQAANEILRSFVGPILRQSIWDSWKTFGGGLRPAYGEMFRHHPGAIGSNPFDQVSFDVVMRIIASQETVWAEGVHQAPRRDAPRSAQQGVSGSGGRVERTARFPDDAIAA